jgi:hypothetical protein
MRWHGADPMSWLKHEQVVRQFRTTGQGSDNGLNGQRWPISGAAECQRVAVTQLEDPGGQEERGSVTVTGYTSTQPIGIEAGRYSETSSLQEELLASIPY